MTPEQCDMLKAIESLRSGVPSRSVVRRIPPVQADIDGAFDTLMDSVRQGAAADVGGHERFGPLLLGGEFGSGKTHWIDSLLTKALDANFVCSWIAVNKETPLHDLEKLYRASILSSTDCKRGANSIREIVTDYDADSAPGHRDLFEWAIRARSDGALDPRLGASLELFSNTCDEDTRGQVLNEWMGYPIKVTDFRWLLEKAGQPIPRPFPKVVKDNYTLRFEFIGRLVAAAGYAGWIVFLDEVEMVSKYSIRQRAKSYANLARLLGGAKGQRPAYFGAVAAITPDYTSSVLRDSRKNDFVSIPEKLRGTNVQPFLSDAEAGMRMIDTMRLRVDPPTRSSIRTVYEKVSSLYSGAYGGWEAPDVFERVEFGTTTRMRQHIRAWIMAWDMDRIYGYAAKPEVIKVDQSFDEDDVFERDERDEPRPEMIL